jgi:hypothetical protein
MPGESTVADPHLERLLGRGSRHRRDLIGHSVAGPGEEEARRAVEAT